MRTFLSRDNMSEIKQLFIKAGLEIEEMDFHLSQEGEPVEYQVMTITASGDKDTMEKFKNIRLEEFKEYHQTDIGVEYICGSVYKGMCKYTYDFWKYY